MKKIRYIPYGYTMREGQMEVACDEADVVRYIFDAYIKGASLKEIADDLTRRQISYTEKTCVWDKARIARIIGNDRYIGCDDYDPIVDKSTYEEAAAVKNAKQRNQIEKECEGIAIIRNKVKCGQCEYPMVRHVTSKRTIKESWTCTNPECGTRFRISDSDLLLKINLIINRIIENTELMIPKPKQRYSDSLLVQELQNEIDAEVMREHPSEMFVVEKIRDIASQLYRETNAKEMIVAQIARKRALLMMPQEAFNGECFTDLIEAVILGKDGNVTLITKTETVVSEIGVVCDGGSENPKENGHAD